MPAGSQDTLTYEAPTAVLALDPRSEVGGEQDDDDNEAVSIEFIANAGKHKKRFNTYKKHLMDMLHHLGCACGTFGFLYLRTSCYFASLADMKG
jgi:hypothetical protein